MADSGKKNDWQTPGEQLEDVASMLRGEAPGDVCALRFAVEYLIKSTQSLARTVESQAAAIKSLESERTPKGA